MTRCKQDDNYETQSLGKKNLDSLNSAKTGIRNHTPVSRTLCT